MFMDGPRAGVNTLSRKWVKTLIADRGRFEYLRSRLDLTQTKEVATVTLDSLILAQALPFFLKIDGEGHEPRVL
jgi:hypothetical protein